MHIVLGISDNDASLNAFNWIKSNHLHLWKDLDLTIVHVAEHSSPNIARLRRYEAMAKGFAKTVSTRLLTCQKSVGRTLKEYVRNLQEPMLVLGCTKQKWNVIDYCVRRCECPVVIVQRDYSIFNPSRPVMALAMDVNVHCDRAFSWILQKANLPDNSQLYVVHITPKKTDKPDARRFLASLKPKCFESKRLYSMASALVSYNRGTIPDGIIRFCHDKEVATLMIAAKGDTSRLRLSTSITDVCLRNSSVDIIVWKDEQTHRLATSRYIFKVEGADPTPLRAAPWEISSKTPPVLDLEINKSHSNSLDNSNQEIKMDNCNQEINMKSFSPHQPNYPRVQDIPSYIPEKNTFVPMGSYDVPPITLDPIPHHSRRKNSLTYNMYGQIAKGKNLLAKITGDENTVVEPLSP
jgi:hypothetical protein